MIEGVWGNNRASGFISVDDLTIYEGLDWIRLVNSLDLTSLDWMELNDTESDWTELGQNWFNCHGLSRLDGD